MRLTVIFSLFLTEMLNQVHHTPGKLPQTRIALLRNLQSRQGQKLVKRFPRFNGEGH